MNRRRLGLRPDTLVRKLGGEAMLKRLEENSNRRDRKTHALDAGGDVA